MLDTGTWLDVRYPDYLGSVKGTHPYGVLLLTLRFETSIQVLIIVISLSVDLYINLSFFKDRGNIRQSANF